MGDLVTTFLPIRRAQRYVEKYIAEGKGAADTYLTTGVPAKEHQSVVDRLAKAFGDKGWSYNPPPPLKS